MAIKLSPCCQASFSDANNPIHVEKKIIPVFRCDNCSSLFVHRTVNESHEKIHQNQEYNTYSSHYDQALRLKQAIDTGSISLFTYDYHNNFKYGFFLDQINSTQRKKQNISPVRVLEFGSSSGHFVGYLRALGIDAYGVEISRTACEKSTALFGDFFYHLDELSTISTRFDFVLCAGTIGCTENPRILFDQMYSMLDNSCESKLLFNSTNSDYVAHTSFSWCRTLPPDLIIMFSRSFWKKLLSSKNIRYECIELNLSLKYFAKAIFHSLLKLDMKNCYLYLKTSFNFVNHGFICSHPYGLLYTVYGKK